MTTQLIQAAQQAIDALHEAITFREGGRQKAIDAINALRTAIQQASTAESGPVARAWAEGYRQGIEDERISEANIGIAGFGAKVNPNRENPYANSHPAPGVPEAVAGELDPLRAYEFGQLITKYSESFNGQKWGGVYDSVDRKNLAVALDHLTEAGAMLMNISERLLRTNPAPAASVTDEQIFDVLKQIDPEAKRLPPGMSKFARAILALRPAAVPMTREQVFASDELMALNGSVLGLSMNDLMNVIRVIESHHGITAQAKKGDA